MSGEKAVAINRAWEQWPNIDPEAVAGMVAAGWDAHAAQVVPQPDREALMKAIISVAEHDPDAHDFISPEKAADAVLAALSPAPLTINRDALAKVALKTYNQWANLSPLKQMSFGSPSLGELIADAVIAHLSAQTVEGEVEWEYGWNTGSTFMVIGSREDAERWLDSFGAKPGVGDWGSRLRRRRRAPEPDTWTEVPTMPTPELAELFPGTLAALDRLSIRPEVQP